MDENRFEDCVAMPERVPGTCLGCKFDATASPLVCFQKTQMPGCTPARRADGQSIIWVEEAATNKVVESQHVEASVR